MSKRTKSELNAKIEELEKWLKDNPGHANSIEVQHDLREAKTELENWTEDE